MKAVYTLKNLFNGHIPEEYYQNMKVIIEDNQSVVVDWNENTIRFEQKEKHEGNTGRVSRVLYNQICDLNRSLNNRIKELEKELEETRANTPKAYVTLTEHRRVLGDNAWLKACNAASESVLKDRNDAVDKLKEENKMLQANIHDVQKMNEDLRKQLVAEQTLRRISESTCELVNGTGKSEPIGITNDLELTNEKKSTVCKWGPYKVKITDNSSDGLGCKINLKNEEGGCWMALFNKFLEKEKRDQASIKFGVPKIQKVMFRDPATIVFWKDGTKTVVKAHNEQYDPEKGLAMAISKKALGNDRGYYKTFQKWSKKNKEE